MKRTRLLAWLLVTGAALAGLGLALDVCGYFGPSTATDLQPVPPGDQEIAWIDTADIENGWHEFVEAIEAVAKQFQEACPDFQFNKEQAFPERSTAVREVSLAVKPGGPRLWFRCYKI